MIMKVSWDLSRLRTSRAIMHCEIIINQFILPSVELFCL